MPFSVAFIGLIHAKKKQLNKISRKCIFNFDQVSSAEIKKNHNLNHPPLKCTEIRA
jgi:hypothetical protein